jgi:HSP20 family protein
VNGREEDEDRPRATRREFAAWTARWEIRGGWPFFSAAQIEQRFEELIRRRWEVAEREPATDVYVLGDEVWVYVDLPGVDEESVRVRLEEGALVVVATRHVEPPVAQARAAIIERPRGRLRRRIPLPLAAESGHLDLRLESGVLRVHIRPDGDG